MHKVVVLIISLANPGAILPVTKEIIRREKT